VYSEKTFVAFSAEHNTTSARANQYFHAAREKIFRRARLALSGGARTVARARRVTS